MTVDVTEAMIEAGARALQPGYDDWMSATGCEEARAQSDDCIRAALAHLPPDPEVEELKVRLAAYEADADSESEEAAEAETKLLKTELSLASLCESYDKLKADWIDALKREQALAAQLDALATAINNASEVLETDEPWANAEADSIMQLALQSLSSPTIKEPQAPFQTDGQGLLRRSTLMSKEGE